MDIILLKELPGAFSLKLLESERGKFHCLLPSASKSTSETGPIFFLFFLVLFKTNGKFRASKN